MNFDLFLLPHFWRLKASKITFLGEILNSKFRFLAKLRHGKNQHQRTPEKHQHRRIWGGTVAYSVPIPAFPSREPVSIWSK
jgi:hypothetical protein